MSTDAVRAVLRETFVDNPMHAEAIRTLRRLQRTGAETGKVTIVVTIGVIALFYIWTLIAILRYGQDVTQQMLILELTLVTVLLPLTIYGAISGEREKQTWEALILTRLTPGQIIAGKLIWRMAIAVAIVALLSIPIFVGQAAAAYERASQLSSFMPPILSVWDTLRCQAVVLTWALLLASFGLFVSASSRRSIASLAVIVGAMFAVLFIFPMLMALFNQGGGSDPGALVYHPFVLLASVQGLLGRNEEHWMEWSLNAAPIIYSLVAALLLYGTHILLRRLEEPNRR